MVKRLQAGIVCVNHMRPTSVAEEYLQVKQVHVNLNEAPIGWY